MKLTSSPSRNSSITIGIGERCERRIGFFASLRDDDAFAGGQAIGLQHDREAKLAQSRRALPHALATVAKRAVGTPMRSMNLLEWTLLPSSAAFSAVGPTMAMSARAELIDHAGDQRRFRPDDRKVNAQRFR